MITFIFNVEAILEVGINISSLSRDSEKACSVETRLTFCSVYLQCSWGFRTRHCCSLTILIWLVFALIQCLISFVSLLDLKNMLSECINEMYLLLILSTLEYYSFLSSFGTSQRKNLFVHFYYSYSLKMLLA